MKLRSKIVLGIVVLTLVGVFFLGRPNPALRQVQITRQSLRQQGFKVDLQEFAWAISPVERERAGILAPGSRGIINSVAPPGGAISDVGNLLKPLGSNTALVVWKLERLRGNRRPDLWAELRDNLSTDGARFEAAGEASSSGPIRFEPIGSQHPNPLLPYLADLKGLSQVFAMRTMLALHDHDTQRAWTNLLASTCLVTEYTPEPIEISHLVRFACLQSAYEVLWNAMQSQNWTESQLAELQRRWERADFWRGLPETAAYSRASATASVQMERRQAGNLGMPMREMLRSPRNTWFALVRYWRQLSYRAYGSYEDEKALLLHYRDRELELRRSVLAPNWLAMRELPGSTNWIPFASRYSSAAIVMLRTRQVSMSFQSRGQGILARAAEAESRRRLIVTALALERYKLRQGSYPLNLQSLVPGLLKETPIDFMDGQPLRYRLSEDQRYVLYSVGLDCQDNGGEMRRIKRSGRSEPGLDFGLPQGTDLVWPRPVSAPEHEEQE